MVATHSEGMQLHLSDRSASGYQYVVAKPSGKFQADIKKNSSGKNQFLGSFDTALEAAVCVATHLSLPPPNLHGAKRGAKRALLTSSGSADSGGSAQAEARGGKRQQRQAVLPEAAEAAEACVAAGAVAEGVRAVDGDWTNEEDERIVSLVRASGPKPAAHRPNPTLTADPQPFPSPRQVRASGTRWSKIALVLGGGRTNDAVRNRYNRIKRTATAGASTAAGARRRPERQATKAPPPAPASSRSLVLAPSSAAVQPADTARRPFTLAPGLPDRAPGDRYGKEVAVGSWVLDEEGHRGEIIKRCGAWLKMRTDAGEEYSVRRRSVEVIDSEAEPPPSRALVARREVARPAAPSAPLCVEAAPTAGPLVTQSSVTARDRWRHAIAPIPPPDVFVGIFFDTASGGWCFHAAGRTTHGFPSALAALAACEAQESPQVTVPATHSSMRAL